MQEVIMLVIMGLLVVASIWLKLRQQRRLNDEMNLRAQAPLRTDRRTNWVRSRSARPGGSGDAAP